VPSDQVGRDDLLLGRLRRLGGGHLVAGASVASLSAVSVTAGRSACTVGDPGGSVVAGGCQRHARGDTEDGDAAHDGDRDLVLGHQCRK
jgi:hypothetical protein